jgi:dCTP deaminase
MLLNDRDIRYLCTEDPKDEDWYSSNKFNAWQRVSRELKEIIIAKSALIPRAPVMIEPFSEAVSGGGVISFGLTSAGYDLRLATEIKRFKYPDPLAAVVVNPKLFKDRGYSAVVFQDATGIDGEPFVIPPNSYILGRSMEYLRIPRFLKGHCTGKSTMARSGILINCTPLEPGWNGFLTIEIGNVTPLYACVFPGEGICQLEFTLLTTEPEVDYQSKGGIYQDQQTVTPSRVKE